MKVLAFNGSPRPGGNTNLSLEIVCKRLNEEGIDTEIIQIGKLDLSGCAGCNQCARKRDMKCHLKDDELNNIIEKVKHADGFLFGSPVYFSGMSSQMKAFMDRLFYVQAVNNGLFNNKVGAAVVTVRRTGGSSTFDAINKYITYSEMIMPSSNYWNIVHGHRKGEVIKDDEGVQILETLAKNMAWILKVINKSEIEKPEMTTKVLTNFIR